MGNCMNIFACVRSRRNKKKQKLNKLSQLQEPSTSSTPTTTLNNFPDQNPPIPPPRTKKRGKAMVALASMQAHEPEISKTPEQLIVKAQNRETPEVQKRQTPKTPEPLTINASAQLTSKAQKPVITNDQISGTPKAQVPIAPQALAPLAPKVHPSPLKATKKSTPSRPKTVPKQSKKIGQASLRPLTAPIRSMTEEPLRDSTPLKTLAPLKVTTTPTTSRSITVPITTKKIGLSPLRPVTPPSKFFEKQAPALALTKSNEQTSPKQLRSAPVLIKWTKKRVPVRNTPIVITPPKARIPLRSRLPQIQPPPEPSEATSQKWWVSIKPPSPTLPKSETPLEAPISRKVKTPYKAQIPKSLTPPKSKTPLDIPIPQKDKTPPKTQSPKSSTPMSHPPSPKFDIN